MIKISIIIETFTLVDEYPGCALTDLPVLKVIDGLIDQSYPRELIEIIVVIDEAYPKIVEYLEKRYPDLVIASIKSGRYFSMKNFGLKFATGEVIALLDSDCVPCRDWAAGVAGVITQGADVAAGKTRYSHGGLLAHISGLYDFGHVQIDGQGRLNSFVANNVAFRRTVFERHNFDDRLKRSGGEYLLTGKLRALNYKMVYRCDQLALHEFTDEAKKILLNRIRSGYDAINVNRLDDNGYISERPIMRLGIFAPLGIFVSRVLFDIKRFTSNRHDLDIAIFLLPFFYLLALFIRGIESMAALIGLIYPAYFQKTFDW